MRENHPAYDTLTDRQIVYGFLSAVLITLGLSKIVFFFKRAPKPRH